MPSPYDQIQSRANAVLKTAFDRAVEGLDYPTLSFELAEIRKELAEIKQAICPAPSIILTGVEVREEYNKLLKNVY